MQSFHSLPNYLLHLFVFTFTMIMELQKQPSGSVISTEKLFKNVVKFKLKIPCRSLLFNKILCLKSATLLKKRLRNKFFPVILKNAFYLQNTFGRCCLWFPDSLIYFNNCFYIENIDNAYVKGAATDMRYFVRSKLFTSYVHKKNFSLI